MTLKSSPKLVMRGSIQRVVGNTPYLSHQRPNSLSILYRMPLVLGLAFGQERSKPSTYHRYNSSGSTHEKRTHTLEDSVLRPSVRFEQNQACGTSSSTYRRRLYARRGANKRMGCVLANGAAYRGGGSSSHFSHVFSLSLFCVRLYVELCTT